MRQEKLRPVFVEFVPRELEDGILYISHKYATAIHKCASGCGEQVVTPLNPAAWKLTIDGDAVTLYPSIGNWNYECRSHYWVRRNRIVWAPALSNAEIERVQRRDRADSEKYIERLNEGLDATKFRKPESFWRRSLKHALNIVARLFKE